MFDSANPSLIIVSSPSGAGKSTICRMLESRVENLKLSISTTTRPKRANEVDGKDYFFTSDEQFSQMIVDDSFLEHATVFGNKYGTSKDWVLGELKSGNSVLFDIDWQGARQIREKFDKFAVRTIFLLPPSIEILHNRLRERSKLTKESIELRISKARDEISHWNEYDFVAINDDLESCYNQILEAIKIKKTNKNDKEIAIFASKLIASCS